MTTLSFDYQRDLPLDLHENAVEQRDGVTVKDISYASPARAGDRIAAYLVTPPAEVKPPHAGILFAHWLEPEAQNSNRTQFLDEAVTLARDGVISVLPDCFWSTTPAKAAGVRQFGWKTDVEHDTALSIRQVMDLRRSLDVLLAQPGIDPARIGYIGHDFGAMYGSLVAAVDRRVKAYVLMAGTYSFADWFVFGSDFSLEQQQKYIQAMQPLAPTNFISQAAPAALFFQFAHSDYFVPERAAQTFYDAASQPKEIGWYDATHNMQDMKNETQRDRVAWTRKQLGLVVESTP